MSETHGSHMDWEKPLPPAAVWRISFARGYLELGMVDEALHELAGIDAALQERPEVLLLRGRILLAARKWKELSEQTAHAIRRFPFVPEFYVHAATAYDMLGQDRESSKLWETAPEKVRVSGALRLHVARCEAGLGNSTCARRQLKKALSLDPRLILEARQDPMLAALVGLDAKN